jgi:hypothetical protein
MAGWPDHPTIFEISTLVWLDQLSRDHRDAISLATVPAAEWDRVADLAIDAVWLMGVWERSPRGTEIARADAGLRRQAAALLGDRDPYGDRDGCADAIAGSPYCIHRYVPDGRVGGFSGLDTARAQLQARGIKLILDYVPNHVAPDHPWVSEHPEFLIAGDEHDLERRPHDFIRAGRGIFVCGRELQASPAWSDVVQLNAFHPGLRAAAIETLKTIAEHCDGVRCDMAMLALNDIFARTWGDRAGPAPSREYWSELIGAVRGQRRDFVFLAEAYWDCEWRLMQEGFAFCYDKVLCDRLIHADGPSLRAHLGADVGFQRQLVRFIENHDEDRAAAVLASGRARAAAVAIATLPGATLYYEGQFEGLRARVPVALGRRPDEPPDTELDAFYRTLLPAAAELRDGTWQLAEVTGWPDNDSGANIVAWSWQTAEALFVVAINFSASAAQGQVHFVPTPVRADERPEPWAFTDLLTNQRYARDPADLRVHGLYVDLPAFGAHLLRVPMAVMPPITAPGQEPL